jgi:hypothetical protein
VIGKAGRAGMDRSLAKIAAPQQRRDREPSPPGRVYASMPTDTPPRPPSVPPPEQLPSDPPVPIEEPPEGIPIPPPADPVPFHVVG